VRVAVVNTQIPFVSGGAELLAANLHAALVAAGHTADVVTLPFKWYPAAEIPKHVLMARLADLSESDGRPIDRVIALKFPAYCVRHPQKVVWLLHQHRPAYELWGTESCDLIRYPEGAQVRDFVHETDRRFIPEARAVHAISREVIGRLEPFANVDREPLYPPPDRAETFRSGDAGDYVFFPSRIGPLKRQLLLIDAMAKVRSGVRCVIAGAATGPDIAFQVEHRLNQHGIRDRVLLTGEISHDEKVRYYEGALAVFFGPLREDYGFVTLEAFLSRKAVITCRDSGGPLEFVEDGVSGFVVEPDADAIAERIDRLYLDRRLARDLGEAGCASLAAKDISWPRVLERLLA
jgi:glycosyltransferase involved in cell wall biosynthesis